MIFEATPSRLVLVHEVAHQWFYGMVGNSQFRDPWLDEAFATWAEAVVDEQSAFGYEAALRLPGEVGGTDGRLLRRRHVLRGRLRQGRCRAARRARGRRRRRRSTRRSAATWTPPRGRIATPDDVYAALTDLPAALTPLLEAQALGKDDQPR